MDEVTRMENVKQIRLILGDQLNLQHSWFSNVEPDTLYLMVELKQETEYATHHIQKICAFFAAMRAFAKTIEAQGHQVEYLTLNDSAGFKDFPSIISALCEEYKVSEFEYQRPDEYRLLEQLTRMQLPIPTRCVDSEHFLLPFNEISQHFEQGKSKVMETFYRAMRKRFNLLIDEKGKPVGGKWNYDANNRQKFKKSDLTSIPSPLLFNNPVDDILAMLEQHKVETIGDTATELPWAIDREQGLALLDYFCRICLPRFGHFQDAMTANHPHKWSLFHSRLSFLLNTKILSPLEVIKTAMKAFKDQTDVISLPQIEGFVRQILGWREYIRGIYWTNMPVYSEINALNAERDLPRFYWHGKTRMQCMHQAISQSLTQSYAHHIQRLMVTGNFALITGCQPSQVDAWYLGIYLDAIEWVEMPNTRGMALFADGGIIATKPYASSGSYINKMSDYCQSCHYQVKEKVGNMACPFNAFYWRFLHLHEKRLAKNPRVRMIYRAWDNFDETLQQEILRTAEANLARLDDL